MSSLSRRHRLHLALALVLAGCATSDPRAATTPATTPAPATTPSPSPSGAAVGYRVHEWGVITASRAGVLVSAGPPLPEVQISVEKPVLYVHTDQPRDLTLAVEVGAGFSVPEHYPPTSDLRWTLRATPGPCAHRHGYPTYCAAVDGRCEIPELPRYETRDAACLRVGPDEQELPLLFYRLGATGPIALPVEVRVEGGSVRARAPRGALHAFRVAYVGGEVRAEAVALGSAFTALPTPSGSWEVAASAIDGSLRASGLSDPERAAFRSAWWHELFAVAVETPPQPAEDQEESEQQRPDAPEESERLGLPVLDVLLYMLPADEIDRVARLVITPAPSAVARAFLVRQVL